MLEYTGKNPFTHINSIYMKMQFSGIVYQEHIYNMDGNFVNTSMYVCTNYTNLFN